MPFPRLAGLILHPTSLPGGHGIGDLGAAARQFADFLHNAAVGIWQVLPLGPAAGSGSPYQAISSYAGNPLLISLDNLVELDLLERRDLAGAPANSDQADFAAAAGFKAAALRTALDNFLDARADASLAEEFERFCDDKAWWLDEFALFVAAKEFFGGQAWFQWKDRDLALRRADAVKKYHKLLNYEVKYHKFAQFLFFRQWRELRAYAAERHIRFLGDIPIYCAHDSADVWAAPQFFQLDAEGGASHMAGVPPDYFSPTGQLWGNPLYDWEAIAADSYRWWVDRVRASLDLVDMLRVDHFRGFEAYWSVAQGETTAENGRWIKGPGQALFDAFKAALGDDLPILAEDLGVITPAVDTLRTANGLPGMKVLHFAFSDGAESYLPHNYETNTVCYVATHDNDTTRGWYDAVGPDYEHMSPEALEYERDKARRYLGRDGQNMPWDLMRLALASVADTAMMLTQDVYDLPNAARMNRPGLGEGQWRWRLTGDQLDHAPWGGLRDMIHLYERQPVKKRREAVEDVETEE